MKLKSSKFNFAAFSLIFLALFVLDFYTGYIESAPVFLSYLSSFVRDGVFVIAALMLSLIPARRFRCVGTKKCALILLFASFAPLFYLLPSAYVRLTLLGARLTEAILYSLLLLFVFLILSYAALFLLTFVFIFSFRKFSKNGENQAINLMEKCNTGPIYTMENALDKSIFLFALIPNIILLIFELYDSTVYLVNYFETIRIGELIYMLSRYVFIFALYLLSVFSVKKILKNTEAK
jgi:hypothetical protein